MAAQNVGEKTLPPPWMSPKHGTAVTLRAGEDGAEACVPSASLMKFSGVFSGLLSGDVALKDNVIPLPGKSAEELHILCSFLEPNLTRYELVTLDNAAVFCQMAQEYDMPRMRDAVEEGLLQQAEQLMDLNGNSFVEGGSRIVRGKGSSVKEKAVYKRIRLLLLADAHKMTRLHERIIHVLKQAPWAVLDLPDDFPAELKAQTSTMQTSTVGELLSILSESIMSLESEIHHLKALLPSYKRVRHALPRMITRIEVMPSIKTSCRASGRLVDEFVCCVRYDEEDMIAIVRRRVGAGRVRASPRRPHYSSSHRPRHPGSHGPTSFAPPSLGTARCACARPFCDHDVRLPGRSLKPAPTPASVCRCSARCQRLCGQRGAQPRSVRGGGHCGSCERASEWAHSGSGTRRVGCSVPSGRAAAGARLLKRRQGRGS